MRLAALPLLLAPLLLSPLAQAAALSQRIQVVANLVRCHGDGSTVRVLVAIPLPNAALLAIDIVDVSGERTLPWSPDNNRSRRHIQTQFILTKAAKGFGIFDVPFFIKPWPTFWQLAVHEVIEK